jgi:hypothetical protein
MDHHTATEGRRSRRRPVIIVVLVLIALGGVATCLGINGWGAGRSHPAGPALPTAKPAPVQSRSPIPPHAVLNGEYRLTLEDSKSMYVRSSPSEWSPGSADHTGYIDFSTSCAGADCIATSTVPDIPNTSPLGSTDETMVWVSGEWSSREKPTPDGDGMDESSTILYPDGHDGFRGTTTDTIISGPHAGAQLIAPVVLTPVLDPTNL